MRAKKYLAAAAATAVGLSVLAIAPAAQANVESSAETSSLELRAKKKKKRAPGASATMTQVPNYGGKIRLAIKTKAKKAQVRYRFVTTERIKIKTVKTRKGTAATSVLAVSSNRKLPVIHVRGRAGKKASKWKRVKVQKLSNAQFRTQVANAVKKQAAAGKWCGQKAAKVNLDTSTKYDSFARTGKQITPEHQGGQFNGSLTNVSVAETVEYITCQFTATPNKLGLYVTSTKSVWGNKNVKVAVDYPLY